MMTEEEAMAREAAADMKGYTGYNGGSKRMAFMDGWDAAMEHTAKKAAEGIEHLDET